MSLRVEFLVAILVGCVGLFVVIFKNSSSQKYLGLSLTQ